MGKGINQTIKTIFITIVKYFVLSPNTGETARIAFLNSNNNNNNDYNSSNNNNNNIIEIENGNN